MTPPVLPLDTDPELTALLVACELPATDLDASAHLKLYGCRVNGGLVGTVGLECHAPAALLRSLAVARSQRGQGMGQALVASAEGYAAAQGITTLYLLTTTAAPFFAALGYRLTERTEAPAAIRATTQFAGLCPASATFMSKRLRA